MSACTEYFNVLEQTCEVVDGNTIIMPDDLQADVILPIVNFMYTGMLEFQMSIFDKLYRTADIMNIPILTKLLDAQKKPIPPLPKSQNKKTQATWNLHGKKISPRVEDDLPATLPGRKLPVWKRKTVPVAQPPPVTTTQYYREPKKVQQDPLALFDNTPKPTRFEWPEDEINSTFNLMENSFDDISYTSKPLLTQDDELRASTSFDDIKYTSSVNKKSNKDYNPAIDMEEVKSYVKEQKIRSDLVEYDDEDDPDSYLESVNIEQDNKRKATKPISPVHTKKVRFSVNEKENKEAKINVTATGKTPEMDHTKIISEVLKKYPHLVKKNKNIRLKILAKSPTKSDTPKITGNKTSTSKVKVHVASPKTSPRVTKVSAGDLSKSQDEGPWVCTKCSSREEQVEFVLYYLYRKHMTDVHHEKFDSRMCKFCGHQSNKHNLLMYHQYTRHGIKPPPAYNFPKCNRCPYIALTENLLIKHKLNHTKFDLQCMECKVAFNNQNSLSSHMQITGHTGKTGRHNYDCQYCTKRYHSGSNLFSHIKMVHRDEARRDGIVSIDEKDEVDEDQLEEEVEEYLLPIEEKQKEKFKMLTDSKVAPVSAESTNQAAEGTSATTTGAHERVTTTGSSIEHVTGGIATSLGLVDIVVLDENQQYILHNDQQLVTQQTLANEQREYIIPEMAEQHSFTQTQNINEVITSEHNVITQSIINNSDIASTDELVMVLTDHDYNDGNNEILSSENSNIVVLYSHPVDGQQNQFIASQGNLMLNSQTGMLEIRNSDPNSMDNSQDAQIESIEMIQREINSHNIISTPHSEATVPTTSSFGESLAESRVILEENQFSDTNLIENRQQEQEATAEPPTDEIDVNKIISEGEKPMQENIQDVHSEVLILNDCLTNQQEEPMEIDEDCIVQENQIENQHLLVQEDIETNMPSDVSVKHQEQPSSKSMPDIDDVTETIVSQTETNELPDRVDHTEPQTDENTDPSARYSEGNGEVTLETESTTSIDCTQEKSFIPDVTTNVIPTLDAESIECSTEESHIQETQLVASEETSGQSEIQPCSAETSETAEVKELLPNDENIEENKMEVENDDLCAVEEPEMGRVEEIEMQHEPIPQENFENVENISTEIQQAAESSTEIQQTAELSEDYHTDLPNEHKTPEVEDIQHRTPEIDVHSEEVETHEEVTQHVEELVQNMEETVETEETITEDENIQQSEHTEHEGQVEEDTIAVEQSICETQGQPGQIVESQVEDSQLQLEEVRAGEQQIEEPQIEETQIEEPQMEEPQIEEPQIEQVEDNSSYMEINLQTEEVSSHMDVIPSQIDENSVQNESADEAYKEKDKYHEEVSQTDDKSNLGEQLTEESVSTVDENSQSQDSQISQCSSRQEELMREYKKSTSQATKISILNDWEDTEDSQQSDNVSKKAESTVRKLIHDWDDDDEEDHESDS
ncbi:putative metal ion binding protein [Trypoxylus dichotomus]